MTVHHRSINLIIDQSTYFTDEHGIIHEMSAPKVSYDTEYVSVYDDLGVKSRAMSYLRLGYMMGVIGFHGPRTLLDVGYGNGDFLRACANAGLTAIGYDISGVKVPDARIQTTSNPDCLNTPVDVVAFFDSLEHFPDPTSLIKRLNAQFIVLSLPWCHWDMKEEAFKTWKHRKPGEHLHHFGINQLKAWLRSLDYIYLNHGNIEDAIRGPLNGMDNILSAIFMRNKRL